MCGYIGNTIDSPLTQALMDILGLGSQLPALHNNPGSGPASLVDIIIQGDTGPVVVQATWWLLLEKTDNQRLRPSRYTSFNTRSDKLNVRRSAGYLPYRQSRCIVPATYIIEGEGAKGQRRYHRIEPSSRSFALGGLYRQWLNRHTGESQLSCSVITLPPHPQWRTIHSKSTPLFLPAEQPALIADWLNPGMHEVQRFDALLQPQFHDTLICTPVLRPGDQQVIGPPIHLSDQRPP